MKGCLILVVLALLVIVGVAGCIAHQASSETDAWCQQADDFYAENPSDSNRQLEREYALECQ